MEVLQKNELLEFLPDTLHAVRKSHDMDKTGVLDNAIDIMDEWIKKQEHFIKKNYDRDYLERLIITCKGSLQRAKQRLDKLCTLRTLNPLFFADYTDVEKEFSNIDKIFYLCPLPKMDDDHMRIFYIRNEGKQFDREAFVSFYRFLSLQVEYIKWHDYADGYVFIFDLREANVKDLILKFELQMTGQFATLVTDGYGLRLKGIYFLTDSKLMSVLVSLIKQVLSEKLSQRIQVHTTLESLYEACPKNILPKECGGDEKSIHELHENWQNALNSEEFKNKWRQMILGKTDESLRSADNCTGQYRSLGLDIF